LHPSGTTRCGTALEEFSSFTTEEDIDMMRQSWLLATAMVVGLNLATTSRADDTIKLDLKSKDAVKTTKLLGDGGADTLEVRHWRGYYRPYYYGYYPRYYYPRYYYPRAYSYYYPRVGFGLNIGQPYYYGYTYAPPAVYYPEPVYVAPIGLNVRAPFVSLNITRTPRQVAPAESEPIPAPRPAQPKRDDGTFQYDGGPSNPVPMPQAEPAPSRTTPVIPEGRVVSRSAESPKYSYPAYGEKANQRPTEPRQLAAKPAK
jgi:hypothetical protein